MPACGPFSILPNEKRNTCNLSCIMQPNTVYLSFFLSFYLSKRAVLIRSRRTSISRINKKAALDFEKSLHFLVQRWVRAARRVSANEKDGGGRMQVALQNLKVTWISGEITLHGSNFTLRSSSGWNVMKEFTNVCSMRIEASCKGKLFSRLRECRA